ncbi:aminodeoxychorismate/anthranilate synthase component II [Granulicella mallensis]|uniref:Para-aminobenzoate synthetase n=1 Tax=Granulicella mallensis TaxID=940614 RepID=A0A7W7ZVD6_9BACT|nr:aminodeoxychorismate/anthranilate synthase component II [Granulicella mallensis]MBB5066885.1 para-aminobenzoate synthetase [Granulicella mallensis]
MKIALIDNYDSFTYNIRDLIYRVSGISATVFCNDEISYSAFADFNADCVVISPGPGHPARAQDFGICADILQHSEKPVFGICLGHQGIGVAFGGKVDLAPQPVHGQIAVISHEGQGLFEGIPQRVKMVRYHSLIVDSDLPEPLYKTAWTDEGLIMGLQHRERSIFGVQFHPESICSEFGETLMANFLREVKL